MMSVGSILVGVAVALVAFTYIAHPFRRAQSDAPVEDDIETWVKTHTPTPPPVPAAPPSSAAPSSHSHPATHFCPQCGRSVEPDHRFCPTCGTRLPETEAAE